MSLKIALLSQAESFNARTKSWFFAVTRWAGRQVLVLVCIVRVKSQVGCSVPFWVCWARSGVHPFYSSNLLLLPKFNERSLNVFFCVV